MKPPMEDKKLLLGRLARAGMIAGVLAGCGGSTGGEPPAAPAAGEPSGEKHQCKAGHSCGGQMESEDDGDAAAAPARPRVAAIQASPPRFRRARALVHAPVGSALLAGHVGG
jgi:hypothetical protein